MTCRIVLHVSANNEQQVDFAWCLSSTSQVEALASPAQHELPAFGGLLEEPTFRDLGLTSQLQAEAASPGACMLPEDLYQSQEGSVWQTPSPSTLQPPPGLTRKPRPMSAGHAASRLSSPGGATSCSPAPASRHLRALQENQQQSPSTSRAGKQQHPDKRPHSAARHSHVAELQQLLQAAEMRAEAAKAAAQHAQLQEGRLAQQLAAHQSYTNNLIGELCIVLSGIDTDGSKTKDSASSQHTDNSSKPAAAGSPAPPSVKPSPISPLLGKQAPALVHQAKTAARRCVLAEQQAALSRKIAEATEVKLAAAEKRAAQLQAALQQSKCQAAAAAVSMGQQPQLTQEPQGVMLRQLMCDLTAARADNPAVQLQLLRARVPDRLWGGQNKGKKASVVMSAAAALERHKVASAAAQREVCNSITEAAAAGEKVRQLMQTWGSGGTTPAARTILSDLQQKQSLLVVAVCELLLSDFLTVLDDSQLRHCRTPWMDFPAAHVLLQPTSGSVGQTLEEARRVSEACVAAGRSLEKLLSKCGSA